MTSLIENWESYSVNTDDEASLEASVQVSPSSQVDFILEDFDLISASSFPPFGYGEHQDGTPVDSIPASLCDADPSQVWANTFVSKISPEQTDISVSHFV
jgi:hypothetical protein